jgi:hypothetical protein
MTADTSTAASTIAVASTRVTTLRQAQGGQDHALRQAQDDTMFGQAQDDTMLGQAQDDMVIGDRANVEQSEARR